jgi:HSP20 family protein
VNQLAVQRQSRPLLPELSELFSGFPTFAGLASLRSFFDSNLMRLEDETKDGVYEVRAELPGVDPTDDIEVTVRDGQLTIKAERTQTSESNGHSEFLLRLVRADRRTARWRRRGRHPRHL